MKVLMFPQNQPFRQTLLFPQFLNCLTTHLIHLNLTTHLIHLNLTIRLNLQTL
jgi:hypothetical protein